MSEILIEEYRGSVLDNVHFGRICGVNEQGEAQYAVGDIDLLAYMRSSAKPIQALPAIRRGVQDQFGLTDKELTLLAASHRGEAFHVDALESLSKKIGASEADLLCSPAYPLSEERRDELIKRDCGKRKMYHNCSGKHFGMLALCKMLGVSMDHYWEPDHPVQKEILATMAVLSGTDQADIRLGVDGCGVPVFALPLKSIAKAYLHLACPDLIENDELKAAVRKLTRLMNENREMVGGTRQICSTLLADPNIVAKGGAKGIYCFGLKKERLGFALKIDDGSQEEWPLVVAGILQQIHYQNESTIESMLQLAERTVINDNRRVVGENKIAFQLKKRRG